ncbi:MAG: bifunctional nuclease family protein [Treponema sp.]|jgi:bifunctional DNase/RNase|nr:bifunctional nuclease family protein [Treponema sp.]
MQEAEIWGIAETGDGNIVFIKPLNSEYAVPIFIGRLEAQAILIGFGGAAVPRPLTADLFLSLTREAQCSLVRVEICDLKDNTFHARLVFSRTPGKNQEIVREETAFARGDFVLDARPSDALALAVRCKCPLYVAEPVVKEAGIPAEELIHPGVDRELQKELLQAELGEAVAVENYEKAAEIRDMLYRMEAAGSGGDRGDNPEGPSWV